MLSTWKVMRNVQNSINWLNTWNIWHTWNIWSVQFKWKYYFLVQSYPKIKQFSRNEKFHKLVTMEGLGNLLSLTCFFFCNLVPLIQVSGYDSFQSNNNILMERKVFDISLFVYLHFCICVFAFVCFWICICMFLNLYLCVSEFVFLVFVHLFWQRQDCFLLNQPDFTDKKRLQRQTKATDSIHVQRHPCLFVCKETF